jgi:hypothetical protein
MLQLMLSAGIKADNQTARRQAASYFAARWTFAARLHLDKASWLSLMPSIFNELITQCVSVL